MTAFELQKHLDEWYPGQFIAENVDPTDLTRVRRRGHGRDFEDEDLVGLYDLRENESLTLEMIKEDVDHFLIEGSG